MNDHDTRIRAAIFDLLDASPPAPPLPHIEPTLGRPPRPGRGRPVLALGIAIVTLVAGTAVVVANQSDDDAQVVTGTTSRRALPPAASVSCATVIGSTDVLTLGRKAVLGRVALSTGRALQANRTGEGPEPLFAKDGLLVRRRSRFQLIVPAAWRNRLSLEWGDSGRTDRLRFSGCPASTPGQQWLAFAGGYYVTEPACVPLIVKTAKESRRVRIGVGAPCPGQAPPAPGV